MSASRRRPRRSAAVRPPLQARIGQPLRRLGAALPSLGALLVAGLLVVLLERGVSALYAQPVRQIVVAGHLDPAHRRGVQETLQAQIDRGLLGLPLRAIRDELEALPWVYRARLRRRFPDTLEVAIVEQRPIARWGDGGFLNHEAQVIAVADAAAWQSLPRIRGPEGSQARLMHRYQRLLELLRPLQLTPVRLEEDAFGQLAATLDNGVELRLGDREFLRRVEDFRLLWRRELQSQAAQVLRVDMRYDSGAAVALRELPLPETLAALDGGH